MCAAGDMRCGRIGRNWTLARTQCRRRTTRTTVHATSYLVLSFFDFATRPRFVHDRSRSARQTCRHDAYQRVPPGTRRRSRWLIASASALAEIARDGGQDGSVDLGWPYGKRSGRQLYFFSVRYYLSGTQITKKNEENDMCFYCKYIAEELSKKQNPIAETREIRCVDQMQHVTNQNEFWTARY